MTRRRAALEKLTKNPRFAWDAYRRFISMFGRIVQDIPAEKFDHALEAKKKANRAKGDTDLTPKALQELVTEFKEIVRRETKKPFPTEPLDQLRLAIEAVFGSWFGRRAVDYRNAFKIRHDLGTAVNVQSMVFGNMGDDSGHRRRLHARSRTPARRSSTGSTSSTRRARMSSPASGRRRRSHR